MAKRPIADPDWRKRPRKPAHAKRSAKLTVRLTEAELLAITEAAHSAGQSIASYIVACCNRPGRKRKIPAN